MAKLKCYLCEKVFDEKKLIYTKDPDELMCPMCGARDTLDIAKLFISELSTDWIPVSERLPEDMQRVLVWFEYYRYGDYNCMYQTYGFGYVCDGKWSPFINGESGWQDARIIAWLPLPEPYKEAENDAS